jgi:hypothetical protein
LTWEPSMFSTPLADEYTVDIYSLDPVMGAGRGFLAFPCIRFYVFRIWTKSHHSSSPFSEMAWVQFRSTNRFIKGLENKRGDYFFQVPSFKFTFSTPTHMRLHRRECHKADS